ncbi:MAG: peptidase M19 [Hellea sp.]|nr:peptidase M19 [Hellea sp.]
MRKTLTWLGIIVAAGLMAAIIYIFGILVPSTDAGMNSVAEHAPYEISDEVQKLHDSLTIADLHGDALLWRRNPVHRHKRGHIDLPRLRDGGVDIQIFSTVTKSPRGLNFDGNSAGAPDDIKMLAMAQLWPIKTWNSIYERAAFQAHRLQTIEANSKNNLRIVRTKKDLNQADGTLLAILATEGSHPLEGELENIDRLYDKGFRMMGLQHFFDNKLGGSLHGEVKGGLTPFGREAVLKMHAMNIIVDVAHSSENVVTDVLALSPEPIIISHGGIRSDCANTQKRNLPDAHLVEIARRGGLMGVGYFDGAICDITPAGIADAILGAVKLMGVDAVALGSDFDGSVHTALDTSELAAITQALKDRGVSETDIRKIMGGNVKRFLAEHLPD